jgi:hypothetical protein
LTDDEKHPGILAIIANTPSLIDSIASILFGMAPVITESKRNPMHNRLFFFEYFILNQ